MQVCLCCSVLQHVALICIVVCSGYLTDSLPDARDLSPLLISQNPSIQEILACISTRSPDNSCEYFLRHRHMYLGFYVSGNAKIMCGVHSHTLVHMHMNIRQQHTLTLTHSYTLTLRVVDVCSCACVRVYVQRMFTYMLYMFMYMLTYVHVYVQ